MSKFSERQLAIRRLCLDGRGALTRDARLLAADLRRFCHADGRGTLAYSPVTGVIDPVASAAMAARREVYDRLKRLLNLDEYVDTNLRDEE